MDAMENQPNYLKGEAKCICSKLFLYEVFSLCIAIQTYFKIKTSQINKSWNICAIEVRQSDTIVYVYQLNVYILPCLSNSRRRMEISSWTHMDHCSTKHTCSNSACQMFADKWLYSRTQKKKKKIISDKQRYRHMTEHNNLCQSA